MNRLYIIFLSLIFVSSNSSFAQKQLKWEPLISNTNALAFALNPLDDSILYTTKNGRFQVSHNAGQNWESRGTVPNLEIRNITICPSDTSIIIMYANNSLLRSTDNGFNFSEVLSGVSMDGETIEFHPTEPDSVFYVDFFSGDLWVSGDRGATWHVRTKISLNWVCSFSINPSNPKMMVVGAGSTRIKRSTDGGFSWELVKEGNPYFSEIPKIKWDPSKENRAFGATYLDANFSIFRSDDNGLTWSKPGIFGINMWALDIAPNGEVYIGSFASNQKSKIYKSYDSGDSWQLSADIPGTAVWMIKTANDSVVSALSLDGFFGIGGIYRLRIPEMGFLSGTLTDSISGLTIEYAKITVKETGDTVHVGNNKGSYKMALLPGTYTVTYAAYGLEKTLHNVAINAGDINQLSIDIPVDIRELSFNGSIKDVNGKAIPGDITLDYLLPTTEQITRKVTSDENGFFQLDSLLSIYQYTNLKIEPMVLPYFPFETDTFNVTADQEFILDFADLFLADASGDPGAIHSYQLALEKIGITWVVSDVLLSDKDVTSEIVANTKKKTLVWFSRHDSTTILNSTLDSLNKIVNAGHNLIMSGQDMLEYNNQNEFFQKMKIGFSSNYSIVGFADPVPGIEGNPVGQDLSGTIRTGNQPSADILSYSTENSSQVFYYGNSISDIENVAGVTVKNTGNGGMAVILGFDLDLQTPIVASEVIQRSLDWFDGLTPIDEQLAIIPQKTELYQNFPNPFNPITVIRYQLTENNKVTLKIFDMLGREIETLVNKKQLPGKYAVTFKGSNLASSVYFFKLITPNFEQTRKMLLIR